MTDCNCDSTNPYMGPWHAIGCCRMYAPAASATDPLTATYTAAEVKVLTETASKVAYALGRKDAIAEINQWIFDQQHKRGTNGHKWNAYMNVASQLRNIASHPFRAASDAISVPSEGPGTSEPSKAVKTPQGGPDA